MKTFGVAKNMNQKQYKALYDKARLQAETHFATEFFQLVESCEVDARVDFVFRSKTGKVFEVTLQS